MYDNPATGMVDVLQDYSIKLRTYGWIGCRKAAEWLLAESKKLTPIKTGFLHKLGGRVEKIDSRSNKRVTYQVIYEAYAPWSRLSDGKRYNYAWRIHEDLSLNHPNGGQAKYLEQPYRENKAFLFDIVRANVKEAFK